MTNGSRIAIGVIALVVLVGGIWATMNFFSDDKGTVAQIQADNSAYKSKPDEAGGMDIPHQDKMVFNAGGKSVDVEHLTPPPEQPIDAMTASNDKAPSVETPSMATEPSMPASANAIVIASKDEPAAALGRTVQPDGKAQAPAPVTAAPVEAAPAFNAGKTDAPKSIKSVESKAAAKIEAVEVEAPKPVPPATANAPAQPAIEQVTPPAAEEKAAPEANMAMEPMKAPEKVTQKASGSRVQLASFTDRPAAQRAVNTFSKKYGSLQNVNIVEATVKGRRVYRVQASGTCSAVKSQGGTCVVVRP